MSKLCLNNSSDKVQWIYYCLPISNECKSGLSIMSHDRLRQLLSAQRARVAGQLPPRLQTVFNKVIYVPPLWVILCCWKCYRMKHMTWHVWYDAYDMQHIIYLTNTLTQSVAPSPSEIQFELIPIDGSDLAWKLMIDTNRA